MLQRKFLTRRLLVKNKKGTAKAQYLFPWKFTSSYSSNANFAAPYIPASFPSFASTILARSSVIHTYL